MGRTAATWSSTRRALTLGLGALAVLVLGVIGWSVFASISGAVIVSGWVASASRNQVVEHIDGGTVSEVLVRDGDSVAAHEVLLRFDDVLPRSQEVAVAQLAPIHVDQVYPGQPATLRFSAFPARTTPEFRGRVEQVSADALRDPQSGRSWFQLEVSLGGPADRGRADAAGLAGLTLTPGMPVEIHIQTGERSPISYLGKPLTDFFLRSLREE